MHPIRTPLQSYYEISAQDGGANISVAAVVHVQCSSAGAPRRPHGPLCEAVLVSYAMREAGRGPAPSAASDKHSCCTTVQPYYAVHSSTAVLVVRYEYSPATHFCRKYVQYSTALPFFLDSGGLGPRDGFVSSAPISCSQLSRSGLPLGLWLCCSCYTSPRLGSMPPDAPFVYILLEHREARIHGPERLI
eukprot:COSAG01_NODE_2367_length_7815_cov_35.065319_4_plen_190_part_00